MVVDIVLVLSSHIGRAKAFTLLLHQLLHQRQMWGPVEMLQGCRAAVRLQPVAVESGHMTGRGRGTSAELDVGR